MREIKLLEQKSEIGAGTRGASLGIDALIVSSLNANSDFFHQHEIISIPHRNDLLLKENNTPSAIRIEGIVDVYNYTAKAVREVLIENDFPLVLSADHASAGGTIAGIKMAYPNKRVGVVWIDAHGDLHSPYTSPTGNVHGMPLATALDEDNLDCKIKEIDEGSKKGWEALKNCGGICPKIEYEDLVFFGVRDTEKPEDQLIAKHNIRNFSVEECREIGLKSAVGQALKLLFHCDLLYVSFDVDSMDCDLVSHGTGTPVPNGFLPEEAQDIITALIGSGKVKVFEMVEINPTLDEKKNKMADTAFKILETSYQKIEESLR